ncbi:MULTISPECIES: ABC transporter ATP-binding protein [unclassified Ruminococcus]|uniref:ABC transporter ATP-binding protein n=1 Tax=unclassified Ruminococcus TaxID=2608920 RepID=UPI00210AEE9C|nr:MULTISPECIES: ABC transporter ATP-binding protein [unclassified Ruminococcus]MCQ4022059.1 ATP-binding cassette domain-containing protein [Ruminococcus sp. zg-924]MCQ4114379.1 ATP-binding cassette domain-containing protein [Ruminococcus sp. zg-921]
MEILNLENLSFKYSTGQDYAINNINLTVEEGEILLLCGSSGSGKTTLLKLIKKELSPVGELNGKITLFGNPRDNENSCDVGLVMQNPHNQIVTDKVWHELAFGLENLGIDKNTIRLRTGEMASFLGISSWFDKNTSELSGGQTQILNLASVMAMQPRLLLLDEPVSQLDPIAAREFLNAVTRLNRETGTTVIMTEHRLEDAFVLADRVAVMENGRIKYCDTPKSIAEQIIKDKASPLFNSLPASSRIYAMTNGDGECPIDVRQGRAYLRKAFEGKYIKQNIEKAKMNNRQRIIKLHNIHFRYQKNTPDVLRQLDLDVYKGESLCILGANGAGKSTLLRMLSGGIKPYIGKMKSDNKHRISMLPQRAELVFLKDNLLEDLTECCKEIGYSDKDGAEKIAQLSQVFNISNLFDRHPYDLSGGETQRAALTKLMLKNPDVLLLDEPTKGIDPNGKKELTGLIKAMCKQGVTVITVTHDIEFSAQTADRCALLFNGEIISCSAPQSFFCGNCFYTTDANRISRGIIDNAVTCEDVAKMWKASEE